MRLNDIMRIKVQSQYKDNLSWYTHVARFIVPTVYPKKYAHGFCFAVLCCGYTLTDFPISIRLTSLALWQSNDCPSASKATLMNMDKYFMWIHYERLHNHNKAKHNETVCIFLGIYCTWGPPGDNRTQVVPMLAPWTLLSGGIPARSMKQSHDCLIFIMWIPILVRWYHYSETAHSCILSVCLNSSPLGQKWSHFGRWYFQKQFCERKVLHFD